jgi:hypothetical protein
MIDTIGTACMILFLLASVGAMFYGWYQGFEKDAHKEDSQDLELELFHVKHTTISTTLSNFDAKLPHKKKN